MLDHIEAAHAATEIESDSDAQQRVSRMIRAEAVAQFCVRLVVGLLAFVGAVNLLARVWP